MSNARMIDPRYPFARAVMSRPSLNRLVVDQDGWAAAQELHERATAALRDLPAVTPVNIEAEVRDALAAGQPLPRGLGERKAKADAEAAARAAERVAIERVRSAASDDLRIMAEESAEDMIPALDAEQAAIIERAGELLDALGGNVDPLAAIRAKKSTQFEEFAELHQDFLRVREDADILLTHEAGRPVLDKDHALHRIMRGAASVWPDWYRAMNEPTHRGILQLVAAAPWPSNPTSLAFFTWLVENRETAQPWVPSHAAMRAQIGADSIAEYEDYQQRYGLPPANAVAPDRYQRGSTAGVAVFGPRPSA